MDYRTLELNDKRFTGFGLSIFFLLIGYFALWFVILSVFFFFSTENKILMDYEYYSSSNFAITTYWYWDTYTSSFRYLEFNFSIIYSIIILISALLITIFGSSIICNNFQKAKKLNKLNIVLSFLTVAIAGIVSFLVYWDKNVYLISEDLAFYLICIFPILQNFILNVVLLRDKNSFNKWSGFKRKDFPTDIPTSYLNKRRINASFYLLFCFFGMFSLMGYIFLRNISTQLNLPYYYYSYYRDVMVAMVYSIIAFSTYVTWLIFGEIIGRRVSRYRRLIREPSLENPIFNEFIVQRTSKFTRKKLVIRELSRDVYHLPTIASHVYLNQQTVLETIRIAIADRKVIGTFSPDNEYFVPPVEGKPVLTSFKSISKPKKVKPGLQAIADSQFDFGLEATKTTTEKSEIVSRQQIVFDRPSNKSRLTALLLCIFLGDLGVHRFYAGKIGTGILWFLTGGLFQIGTIVDTILISMGKFTDRDGNPITKWDTDSPRQQIQPQQPVDYAQQYSQPTQPIQATQPIYSQQPSPTIQQTQTGINRGEVLRKIVKMYDSVLIDEMAQLLYFTDRISFQQWLMSLPEELEFVIHDDKVLIPPYLKDNSVASQQLLDKLTNHLDLR